MEKEENKRLWWNGGKKTEPEENNKIKSAVLPPFQTGAVTCQLNVGQHLFLIPIQVTQQRVHASIKLPARSSSTPSFWLNDTEDTIPPRLVYRNSARFILPGMPIRRSALRSPRADLVAMPDTPLHHRQQI